MVNEQMQFFCVDSVAMRTRWRLMTVWPARSAFYHDHRHQQSEAPRDLGDPPDREDAEFAHTYKYTVSQPYIYPKNDLRTPATSCA
jgi:hypothetical protein